MKKCNNDLLTVTVPHGSHRGTWHTSMRSNLKIFTYFFLDSLSPCVVIKMH